MSGMAGGVMAASYAVMIYCNAIAGLKYRQRENVRLEKTGNDLNKIRDRTISKENTVEGKGSSKTIQNISDLSNEQIEALTKYTGDDYININNSLRGMETLTPENQATAEAIGIV